jgi:predicted ATPase
MDRADSLQLPMLQPGKTFGRDAALDRLADLVDDSAHRLVTLIGPGGVGKTRLALDAARAASHRGRLVAICELAPLVQPADAWPTLASSLAPLDPGISGTLDPAGIAASLPDRPILLLLDNAEHVASGLGDLARLLDHAPRLTVLATSRVPLGLPGELLEPVPTLPLPPPGESSPDRLLQFPAVQLFASRAASMDHDFILTPGNAEPVAELCRRLDGLPLALELAAARVSIIPPALLIERLDRYLALPGASARDSPARQRTLRDTVEWSIAQLDPASRTLLHRIAVFQGTFSIGAAATVAGPGTNPGEIGAMLADLAAASLLQHAAFDPETPGYRMLQTIRDVVRARLADDPAEREVALERHADWVRSEVDRIGGSTLVGDTLGNPALERLAADLVAATDWLEASGRLPDAVAIAVGAGAFWLRAGRSERGLALLSRIPEVEQQWTPEFRALGWYVLSVQLTSASQFLAALDALDAARAAYQVIDRREPGVDHDRCYLMSLLGEYGDARDCFHAFAATYGESVPPGSLAIVWINLAEIEQLDPAPADPAARSGRVRELLERARQDARIAGSDRNLRLAEASLAGELADAAHLGATSDPDGDRAAAWSLLSGPADYFSDGPARDQAIVVSAAARLCLPHAPRQAARLLGAARQLLDVDRMSPGPVESRRLEAIRAAVAGEIGPDAARCSAEGAAWSRAALISTLGDLISTSGSLTD